MSLEETRKGRVKSWGQGCSYNRSGLRLEEVFVLGLALSRDETY